MNANLTNPVVDAIVAQRGRFHRFLTARMSHAEDAEDLLQQSLLKALQRGDQLRRGETAVAWFYRILRNAVADHYRAEAARHRRTERLWTEIQVSGEDVAPPSPVWRAAVCSCFSKLLPALNPRYAEVIRRIDLQGESKLAVARELKIKPGTLDVLLHRARSALRQRLEAFCGACSREKGVECFCVKSDDAPRQG